MKIEKQQQFKEQNILLRISPLLFLPAATLIALLTIFVIYIETTKDDNAFINVAGRQRLIAQQIGSEAHNLAVGESDDSINLQRSVQSFNQALERIEFGGETIFGRKIVPLDSSLVPELNNIKELWQKYLLAVDTIVANHLSQQSLNAYDFIDENTELLVNQSDRLVNKYEVNIKEQRQQVIMILLVFIVLAILSIAGVAFAVRRFVNERRKIEQELEANRERFALAVRGTDDGIWDWDLRSDELYLSDRWKEMLGYTVDEIEDNFISWRDLIHPDDLGIFLTTWSDYMMGATDNIHIEYRLKKKDNDYAWILCRGLASIGDGEQPDRLSGSHSDISEQMHSFENLKEEKRQQAKLLRKLQEAQESIVQSEERLRYSQFFSHTGNIDWNIKKDELFLSELSAQVLGYQIKERVITIDELLNTISSVDREMFSKSLSDCRYQEIGYDLEYRVHLPSGEERWIHSQGDAVRDEEGVATNILGMMQDITEKKRSELRLARSVRQLNESNSQLTEAKDELKKSTEWLQSILNIAPEAIIVFDSEQHITVFNRGAEAVFGYGENEVLGKPLEILLPERFHNSHHQHVKSFENSDEEMLEMRSRSELVGLRKDGAEFPVGASVSKSGQGSNITFTVIIRDQTKQREIDDILQKEQAEQAALIIKLRDAQEQLLQSEKMASIGQLAAGVAHEINNPVGYINSNLGSLQTYLNDLLEIIDMYQSNDSVFKDHEEIYKKIKETEDEKDLEYLKTDIQDLLNESMEGVIRVKQIVQDLKDFSHAEVAEWHLGDIHKGINSTLNVAHNELKYKCKVVKEYGEIPEIDCIISQLNQVFMNLLVNAAHAIEEQGVITVRTGVEGSGIWIEIEDNGKGMEEDTRRRIFEPFFTTKPVGSGTGLGLSLSYGIIQKHNGTISVESEVGKGTKFHIWLPKKHVNIE